MKRQSTILVATSKNLKVTDMDPILYILMRSDMDSLTPGKAMAQASHATNVFVSDISKFVGTNLGTKYDEWCKQTNQNFGTCIVLDVYNEIEMIDIRRRIWDDDPNHERLFCAFVHDPTYPVKDGNMCHHVPINTCAYVFGRKDHAEKYLSNLPLYR